MEPYITLINKYNKLIPRYTSYPPATSFHAGFTGSDFEISVKQSNLESPQNISLYIHIPFCPELCLYCGCNTLITQNRDLVEKYITALVKEVKLIARWIDCSRPVSQVHWGGGTPNTLSTTQIAFIMDQLRESFKITPRSEIAIECNPAYLTETYLTELFNIGFNRISYGIQDFSPEVLKMVGRKPSRLPVNFLVQLARNHGTGVNLDFIYGLPGQTTGSFTDNMREAIELNPDRIVTFSYAHVPRVKPHQEILETRGLPSPSSKLEMFLAAFNVLTSDGNYQPIGFDHFALPNDTLSQALNNGTLHRNFQGYCTRQTTGQVYAFGTSAISQLNSAYAQNHKNVKTYIDMINAGMPAIEKGYTMAQDEKYVREIILTLMCNSFINWQELANRLETNPETLKHACRFNPEIMTPFIDDGLVVMNGEEIRITDHGRFVTRNIAAAFDPKLNETQDCFSGSI